MYGFGLWWVVRSFNHANPNFISHFFLLYIKYKEYMRMYKIFKYFCYILFSLSIIYT